MDKLKIKFNIKKPSDWGSLSIQAIYQSGGAYLLNNYYKYSLFACLQSVYSGLI